MYGPISMSGEVNGNAGFGVKNSPVPSKNANLRETVAAKYPSLPTDGVMGLLKSLGLDSGRDGAHFLGTITKQAVTPALGKQPAPPVAPTLTNAISSAPAAAKAAITPGTNRVGTSIFEGPYNALFGQQGSQQMSPATLKPTSLRNAVNKQQRREAAAGYQWPSVTLSPAGDTMRPLTNSPDEYYLGRSMLNPLWSPKPGALATDNPKSGPSQPFTQLDRSERGQSLWGVSPTAVASRASVSSLFENPATAPHQRLGSAGSYGQLNRDSSNAALLNKRLQRSQPPASPPAVKSGQAAGDLQGTQLMRKLAESPSWVPKSILGGAWSNPDHPQHAQGMEMYRQHKMDPADYMYQQGHPTMRVGQTPAALANANDPANPNLYNRVFGKPTGSLRAHANLAYEEQLPAAMAGQVTPPARLVGPKDPSRYSYSSFPTVTSDNAQFSDYPKSLQQTFLDPATSQRASAGNQLWAGDGRRPLPSKPGGLALESATQPLHGQAHPAPAPAAAPVKPAVPQPIKLGSLQGTQLMRKVAAGLATMFKGVTKGNFARPLAAGRAAVKTVANVPKGQTLLGANKVGPTNPLLQGARAARNVGNAVVAPKIPGLNAAPGTTAPRTLGPMRESMGNTLRTLPTVGMAAGAVGGVLQAAPVLSETLKTTVGLGDQSPLAQQMASDVRGAVPSVVTQAVHDNLKSRPTWRLFGGAVRSPSAAVGTAAEVAASASAPASSMDELMKRLAMKHGPTWAMKAINDPASLGGSLPQAYGRLGIDQVQQLLKKKQRPQPGLQGTQLLQKLSRVSAAGEGNIPYIIRPHSESGVDALKLQRYAYKGRRVDSQLPPRYPAGDNGVRTTTSAK